MSLQVLLHFDTNLLNMCGLSQLQISVVVGMKGACLIVTTALSPLACVTIAVMLLSCAKVRYLAMCA